jgi:hypothetical protein
LGFGIKTIWPYLTATDYATLDTILTSYLKRALCIHSSSQNRLLYSLLDIDSFVGTLQSKFNLPYTAAFGSYLYEREMKFLSIAPDFQYVVDTVFWRKFRKRVILFNNLLKTVFMVFIYIPLNILF